MQSKQSIPRTLQELTPDWLTSVLGERCPGIVVRSVTTEKIIPGTTTKVLLYLEYDGDNTVYDLPSRLCVKGEFDVELRETFREIDTTGTQIEADFFNELGSLLKVPMPRHWYGGSEPGMGILILDNLESAGCDFGTPSKSWRPEQVIKALEVLATLHANTWNTDIPSFPWLHVGSPTTHQYTRHLVSDKHWKKHYSQPGVFQLPAVLKDSERMLRGFEAMWRHNEEKSVCLVHGDAHIGNTVIDTSDRPYFLDWAGVNISTWAMDVAYFLVGSLTVEERRASERDIFEAYLSQLKARGGPNLDRAAAWDEYRRNQLHGFLWGTLPAEMQSIENVHCMGERHCSAIIDHNTLKLLGV